MEIKTKNTYTLANQVYGPLQMAMRSSGSRAGEVLRMKEPITIKMTNPWERVNIDSVRDCNPFFHLFEAMAMLCDYNSATLLSYFSRNMMNFSDNGLTFNSFYGSRARSYQTANKSIDQLAEVINKLEKDPESRQAVITLSSPEDLVVPTKDMACNMVMTFYVLDNKLHLHTYNRSNDAVWGYVTGANVVHFSYFQEYVALALGLEIGDWWHTSTNLHCYKNKQFEKLIKHQAFSKSEDAYTTVFSHIKNPTSNEPAFKIGETRFPMWDTQTSNHLMFSTKLFKFLDYLNMFTEVLAIEKYDEKQLEIVRCYDVFSSFEDFCFIKNTLLPAFKAFIFYKAYKHTNNKQHYTTSENFCHDILAPDWCVACSTWLKRRK